MAVVVPFEHHRPYPAKLQSSPAPQHPRMISSVPMALLFSRRCRCARPCLSSTEHPQLSRMIYVKKVYKNLRSPGSQTSFLRHLFLYGVEGVYRAIHVSPEFGTETNRVKPFFSEAASTAAREDRPDGATVQSPWNLLESAIFARLPARNHESHELRIKICHG
jgi:hypothetical protein